MNNEVTQNENWLPVSANTAYEISDLGRLRHNYKNGTTKIIQPRNNGGKSKYLFYVIDGRKYYAHHLVLFHFVGAKPSDEYEVDHIDRDPRNNFLSNLRYLHYLENRLKGEDHPKAKLTTSEIQIIRQMTNLSGYTQKRIADFFGVSRSHIGKIANNKRWKHI